MLSGRFVSSGKEAECVFLPVGERTVFREGYPEIWRVWDGVVSCRGEAGRRNWIVDVREKGNCEGKGAEVAAD